MNCSSVWSSALLACLLCISCGGDDGVDVVDEEGERSASAAFSIRGAKTSYYKIVGSTADELRQEMDNKGPHGWDSYVSFTYDWYWPGRGTPSCRLQDATVTCSIEVVLPKWDAPSSAPPELHNQWQKFIAALARHEQGHVNIAASYCSIVKAGILHASCTTADDVAQKIADSVQARFDVYDDLTDHGATQGVELAW